MQSTSTDAKVTTMEKTDIDFVMHVINQKVDNKKKKYNYTMW